MADKQITIDVSDCSELCGTKCHILMSCTNTSKSDSCSEMPNCYYKQLKRKEQELQEAMDNYVKLDNQRVKEYNELVDLYKAKEQECEGLKEEIKKHNDDMFKNPPEKRFYCKGCTLPYISKKLKQTLTEIKEIAEKSCCLQPTSTCEEYENCKECSRTSDDETVKQILQKISECEGNDVRS